MSNEFDVVVIGGGPVGLWLACELALAKVKVLVLERRTERVTQSRALTLHGRTLEVFALRGIAERFLSQGRPNPGFFSEGWIRCLISRPWDRAFLSRCSCRKRRLKGSSRKRISASAELGAPRRIAGGTYVKEAWPLDASTPPSTGRFTPFTKLASSLARNAMTLAIS